MGLGLGPGAGGVAAVLPPCSVPLALRGLCAPLPVRRPPCEARVSSTVCRRGESALHPAAPLPRRWAGSAGAMGGRCHVSKGQTLA